MKHASLHCKLARVALDARCLRMWLPGLTPSLPGDLLMRQSDPTVALTPACLHEAMCMLHRMNAQASTPPLLVEAAGTLNISKVTCMHALHGPGCRAELQLPGSTDQQAKQGQVPRKLEGRHIIFILLTLCVECCCCSRGSKLRRHRSANCS